MKQDTPWWGRIATVWLLFAPLCAVLYTLTTTISPNDFWWHAAAGRLLAETGRIPATNHFAWPLPEDAPYVYQNWLAEWLIYKVLQAGGITWIAHWRSAAVGLAFLIMGWTAARRARRFVAEEGAAAPGLQSAVARWTAISLFLSLGMIALNLDARPQTFVLPLYAVVVCLLFELPWRTPGRLCTFRMAAGLVILAAFWANMHGSFFLLLLALLVLVAVEAIYSLWNGGRLRAWFGAALPEGHLPRLGVLLAACVCGIALNPLGLGIFSYVVKLSTNNAVQKYMYEWQPPSLEEGGSIIFFLSPLFLLVSGRIAARRTGREDATGVPNPLGKLGIRPGELALLLVLFVMGCRNIRSILWYALLFPVFFTPLAARAFFTAPAAGGSRMAATQAAQRLNAALLCLLVLAVVPLLPRYKPAIAWPAGFRQRFAPTPPGRFPEGFGSDPELLLDKTTPVAAARYLRANPPRGRLWNDMGYGSYLMWALPGVKVNADPRIELYPNDYWLEYLRISSGPSDAAARLEQRGVTDALLDPEGQKGLVRYLRARRDWREMPVPGGEAILMRRAEPPA